MSKIRHLLPNAYVNAYALPDKIKYSQPKIYDANGDLSKRWFVYYSFRNPLTDKLERQTPIYDGINYIKSLQKRKEAVHILCKAIAFLLQNGSF